MRLVLKKQNKQTGGRRGKEEEEEEKKSRRKYNGTLYTAEQFKCRYFRMHVLEETFCFLGAG